MKQILITGASRGIGRAIAVQFAEKNHTLILTGRNQEKLAETAALVEQKGAKAKIVTADVSRPENVLAFVKQLDIDKLDVLINNAGIAVVEPLAEIKLESWQKTFDTNVTAPFLLIQHFMSRMPKGSSVVNISSIAAKQGFSNWSSYCMSKHALEGFSNAIRDELQGNGIRLISLYPGAVSTDIWTSVPGEQNLDSMMKPEAVALMVYTAVSQPAGTVVEGITMRNLSDI